MKSRLFANPIFTIEIMIGFVVTTTLMALVVLFNSVRGDDWVIDHLNGVISALLSLLIVHRLSLGVSSRWALAAWIAAFVITALLGVSQWFDGYTDRIQQALHVEDLDDLCLWPVTPIGLLAAARFERIGRWPLRILIAGFCAQSLSTVLDLLDGWLTHSVGYDSDLMEVLVDFSEFVFLQFYLVGLTLFVASLYLGRRPAELGAPSSMLGRALPLLRAEIRLKAWRLRNPGRPYAAYYADRIAGKLDRGIAHATLGHKDRAKPEGASSTRHMAGNAAGTLSHRERGAGTFDFLRGLGLEPGQRCVDYGCGSLRIGTHLIDFLDPGNYRGLDITDRFYRDGLALLEPGIVAAKAPRLDVISDATLAAVRDWRPNVLISVSVLMHVPPTELAEFFRRVVGLLCGNARAIILFDRTETDARLSSMSWSYSEATLRACIHAIDPALEISSHYYEAAGGVGDQPVTRHALILARTQRPAIP